jgi:23S rRNA (guanosine2251-2'-O)-methyltransferase
VPLGLVVGSEAEGLRRLVRDRCDWLIRMPMRGRINSLNASIAGSIALYEALRQRQLTI